MDDFSNLIYEEGVEPNSDMGQSESKRSKKKDTAKASKGVATSFGFRRRPASSSRVDNRRCQDLDTNGNKGSTEDLYVETEALSGRSTPLTKPKKEAAGLPLRSNRFGFRQQTKVGDVSTAVEAAFNETSKHTENGYLYNNNPPEKTNIRQRLPPPTAPKPTQPTQKTIKQTVIVTYAPKQYTTTITNSKPYHPRSQSASRAFDYGKTTDYYGRPAEYSRQNTNGRITVQSNLLPKPQVPIKGFDVKNLKQVANNTRKISGSSNGSSREGSVIDSGVSSNGSPTSRRRPRTLQLVMKGNHAFHLRELHVPDLDVMDEALVTDHAVIPLPKFPTTFETEQPRPTLTSQSTFIKPSKVTVNYAHLKADVPQDPKLTTLERYRKLRTGDEKEEKKIEFDRQQKERFDKQNSFVKPDKSDATSSRLSSKDSTPGSRSEAWQHGGEALANRSQDDASVSLSISSCDDVKAKKEVPVTVQLTKKTFIVNDPKVNQECDEIDSNKIPKIEHSTLENSVHPMLCKATDLNYKGAMIGSLTGSSYSATSTATNTDLINLTFTLEETNFNLEALELSTHSLIDEETSPADSLISSSSQSDSNNDLAILEIEKDGSMASSAYMTANTKTKSTNTKEETEEELIQDVIRETNDDKCGTPGTPTHASGSLSISDGKDFFDDEIADQPGLTYQKNEESPSSKIQMDHRRQQEKIVPSPHLRHRKLGSTMAPSESVASLDTVSSLASDDLMLDDNLGRSMTSLQSVQDYVDRLDSSIRSGLNSLDEHQLKKELDSSKCAVKQWNKLLEQNRVLDRELVNMSMHSSTTSLTSIGASLPQRTARLLSRSRVQTPIGESPTDGKELPTANLLQDVVDIKSLLLQLKRVLHEPDDEEHHSQKSESLDPLSRDGPLLPRSDHTAELRKQILFLQSQVEERDRLVKMLQEQMSRLSDNSSSDDRKSRDSAISEDMCNVATQTERIRPPISSNLTHADNPGLVSWSEQVNGRKSQGVDAQIKAKNIRNGLVTPKCTCGAIKYTNGHTKTESEPNKTSNRVGSRYLQAIQRETNGRYIKRDLSVNDRLPKLKNLCNSRSKSIENFQNHNLSYSTEDCQIDSNVDLSKHTSYSDLYNGNIKEGRVNGKLINGNSKSSEMDYSSDSGYKSLPPSLTNGKKLSCIPRRSESKLVCPKNGYRTSAV